MIYIRTCAYNAEKTLKRAVDSILNQTYGEFTYYLLDNGSTDRTGNLIREYAKKDHRIVPFYNKQNRNFSENPDFWSISHRLQDGDYFCILDADDAYESTFLEEMITFLTENQLDMAACGTRFVDDSMGTMLGERILPKSIVLSDAESYERYFPIAHWNLRQVWGKLYTAKAARARYEVDIPECFPKAYGGDTVNVYECVKASDKIGVYAKALHTYTVSQRSTSYRWLKGRETDDHILFKRALEFLHQKCGRVSEQNLGFLYVVHFNALNDTFNVLFHSDLSAKEKVHVVRTIIEQPLSRNAIRIVAKERQPDFNRSLAQKLLSMNDEIDQDAFSDMFEIFLFMNDGFSKYISREHVGWYIMEIPGVIESLIFGEYEKVLDELLEYILLCEEIILPSEEPLVLGQALSSSENQQEKYIFFSKLLIQYFFESHQFDRAQQELSDWLFILPDDEDLLEMKEKYLFTE